MASVSRDPNGTKRILFTGRDRKRKAIRLGKATVKAAEAFKLRVETLIADQNLCRAHDAELAAWLRDLPDDTHAKLATVGLVESREAREEATLGSLVDRFVESATVKPGTLAVYKQAGDSLLNHFGQDFSIDSITAADADAWRKANVDAGLALATVTKRVFVAKNIFRKAVRWKLLTISPFEDLKAGAQHNSARTVYVPRKTVQAVLDCCPDARWRAVVGLARFAGLRCPSEITLLRLSDVSLDGGRLTVRSPKTEAHASHAVRVVPIDPELSPLIEDLLDLAEPRQERLLAGTIGTSSNLRTSLLRVIARAGVEP